MDDTQTQPISTRNTQLEDNLPPSYESVTSLPEFQAIDYVNDRKIHFLLAASGSLATDILPAIIDQLDDRQDVSIRVVLTTVTATRISRESLLYKPAVEAVYTDQDWTEHEPERSNAFLNYELRSWLDFMLVAPCDANTISKIANGIEDNLLTSIIQSFDTDGKLNPPGRRGRCKYLAIAPAMDSAARANPAIKEHIESLHNRWAYDRAHTPKDAISSRSIKIGSERISWCSVLRDRDLLDSEPTEYRNRGSSCSMKLDRVMAVVLWNLSIFRPSHRLYKPGV